MAEGEEKKDYSLFKKISLKDYKPDPAVLAKVLNQGSKPNEPAVPTSKSPRLQ